MEQPPQHTEEDTATVGDPQEECWEHADFSDDFTPHTSRRIELYYSELSPRAETRRSTSIDIRSVDATQMTLLDVCNYMPEPNVDGSGHCVWLGALYLSHALSMGMAFSELTNERLLAGNTVWYNDDYFGPNSTVAELGCGTGAAGIALLKLLSLRSATMDSTTTTTTTTTLLPREFQFWDNDPEALDLCRENVERNIPDMEVTYQMDPGWKLDADVEVLANKNEDKNSSVDTILATDVLYDLKIIRLFLETAARMLRSCSSDAKKTTIDGARKKRLILSHVPRWFLPRNDDYAAAGNKSTTDTKERTRALEDHIIMEAVECGFSLRHTVRPNEVLGQYQMLVSSKESDSESRKVLDDVSKEALKASMEDMDQAGAVLWVLVFDKQ